MRLAAPLLTAIVLAGAAHANEAVHWSYAGPTGPGNWADLSPYFATCTTGQAQSPVDLGEASSPQQARNNPIFRWQPFRPAVVNNGHTIEVRAHGLGGAVVLDGLRYELLQFHFHHPSEHTVDGWHMPMEMHFVHRSDTGALLVVGAFLTVGPANPVIAGLWDALPHAGAQLRLDTAINPGGLLPKERDYVRYAGSLTTPPCTEGVTWLVFADPVTVSSDQLREFLALFPRNNRPVRDLNGRTLIFSGASRLSQ